MSLEHVVLVDESDNELGLMEKQEAHVKGVLHRAFSVFLINDKGELLIQQRAFSKYHSPGLWTNTCCSHPREGETTYEAAKRRLKEEMGIDTEVSKAYDFIYKADVGGGLTEYELDHVYIGSYNANPNFNTEEVADFDYISILQLSEEIINFPEKYTEWFKITFQDFKKHVDGYLNK